MVPCCASNQLAKHCSYSLLIGLGHTATFCASLVLVTTNIKFSPGCMPSLSNLYTWVIIIIHSHLVRKVFDHEITIFAHMYYSPEVARKMDRHVSTGHSSGDHAAPQD